MKEPRACLNQLVHIKIDRPLGSPHPQHGFIYPVNYGYVPNTLAPDGDDLDAYVLGIFDPIEEFTGRCIAIVHRFDDDDNGRVYHIIEYRTTTSAVDAPDLSKGYISWR
jgi:inorganic pyrophosphatase